MPGQGDRPSVISRESTKKVKIKKKRKEERKDKRKGKPRSVERDVIAEKKFCEVPACGFYDIAAKKRRMRVGVSHDITELGVAWRGGWGGSRVSSFSFGRSAHYVTVWGGGVGRGGGGGREALTSEPIANERSTGARPSHVEPRSYLPRTAPARTASCGRREARSDAAGRARFP